MVDATNFSDRTSFYGSRENLRLTERFTRVEPDLLLYRVTVEDETIFARPWTIEVPLASSTTRRTRSTSRPARKGTTP